MSLEKNNKLSATKKLNTKRKEGKKHKPVSHTSAAIKNMVMQAERGYALSRDNGDTVFKRIQRIIILIIERLVKIAVGAMLKLFALFTAGFFIIAAPILILLILIVGAGGVTTSEEETRIMYIQAMEEASPTDAVIAPDAIFVWPATGQYYITSVFGPRWGTIHKGLDIGAPTGTKIVAGADGTVIGAQFNDSMGYYVLIDHGDGKQTYYMHNSSLVVSAGDTVKAGQLIAYSGSTGDSTGPHCHFGLKIDGTFVNPAPYLGLPENVSDGTDVSSIIMGE